MGLVEVLQDDGDVHVDNDHEVDDDERHEEDDGDEGEATVAIWQALVLWITVGGLGRRENVFFLLIAGSLKVIRLGWVMSGQQFWSPLNFPIGSFLSHWQYRLFRNILTFICCKICCRLEQIFDKYFFKYMLASTWDMRGSSTSFQPAEVTSLKFLFFTQLLFLLSSSAFSKHWKRNGRKSGRNVTLLDL